MQQANSIEWFELFSSLEEAYRIFKIGTIKKVNLDGVFVCFGRTSKGFFAIQDQCPHEKVSLSGGSIIGDNVVCPWHHYRFNVNSGENVGGDCPNANSYPVKVEGTKVMVGKIL